MMLVPPQVAREASTATLLRHAVRQVPAEETSTLDDVVACLRRHGRRRRARSWPTCCSTPPRCRWRCCSSAARRRASLGADAALTVITMAGLRLPDLKIEREYWSAEEALALPMLHTAHRLAVRRCYGGSMCVAQAGRPRRGALHGGLALRPVVPGPARPRLPQVEPRRAGRLPEPARHPRPGRAEPRLHRLRRPHRRGRRDRRRGAAAAAGAGRRRLRGRRSPRCPTWTPRRRRGSASASSSCATWTAGCRRSAWTCRTSTACWTTSTPRRRRSAPQPSILPAPARRPGGAEMAHGRERGSSSLVLAARGGGRRVRLAGHAARRAVPRPPRAAGQGAGRPLLDRGVARPTSAAASTELPDVGAARAQCLKAPTPSTPDSGLAGWFAEPPGRAPTSPAPQGLYSKYGYAGYSYTTYDIEAAAPRP